MGLTTAAQADEAVASWCRDWVADLFGPLVASEFVATRRRLTQPFAAANEVQVQEGRWRYRVEDALRGRPDLAEALLDRIAATRARLG
jgi:hypothetical protein